MTTAPELIAGVRAATEGTPYLVEERPYGFDLTINIVDATWWTLLRKSSVKRVFTHQVRLDEDSQRMTVTDVAQSVRWDAGAGLGSPPSLHVEQQVQRGRVYEFSSEKQWGLDAETGQAGKVVDYTFSAKEGRDLVRGVATRDGWSEAMGAEQKVGLAVGLSTLGLIVLVALVVGLYLLLR